MTREARFEITLCVVSVSVHIERILDAARTAPSHDNRQPWRFIVDGETVSFAVDQERDDGAMARIGIGAAIECACIAAARMGATVRTLPPLDGALVTMSFTDAKRLAEPDLSRVRRTTNRRVYDGRAIDDATALFLREATPARELAQTHWFGRERVHALGPLMEEGEELFFADTALRARAVSAIRFDVKDREDVTHGLSVASLELTAAERAALAGFRQRATAVELKKMGARARRLIESASGVCVITATSPAPLADVDVGRAMQRAWMALAQRGLAAHPMTSLAILELTLAAAKPQSSRDTIPDAEGDAMRRIAIEEAEMTRRKRIEEIVGAFRKTFPNVPPEQRIALLLRFGFAAAPSTRVGRRPLGESLVS